jgi:small subunit ribosomal protein S16
MLVIRLQRTGRENTPTYRLVVAEKARPVKGKFMEIVGHYLPARKPAIFEFKSDRIEHWITKGATPSDTLARLLRKAGMKNMDKFIQRYTKQRSKNAPPEEAAPAPAAPTPAPAAEAPTAEAAAPEVPAAEAPAAA